MTKRRTPVPRVPGSSESPLGDRYEKVLLITINHSYAGFFAYVTFVINQLIYAEKQGYLPVVWFGKTSGDGPNAFFDPQRGENTWDYYFEPVAGYTYQDIRSLADDPDASFSEKDLVRLSTDELWRLHREEPDSVYNYPYGRHRDKAQFDPDWYQAQREKAQRYIRKYIQVKPDILREVDRQHGQFAGGAALGIHLRGTDKGTAGSSPHLMRIIKPAAYFPLVEEYTNQNGPCSLFIATDQVQFLDEFRERYGDRVVAAEAIRSDSSLNPFEDIDGRGYQKGRDVLVDCLLLSRCDFLLKCTSAVGEYAMYFNPDLECIDTNHLRNRTTMGDLVGLVRSRGRRTVRSLLWK